jgi:catechol 2,3-dioxygenase-like lactoylglutathione lyase family enzyme
MGHLRSIKLILGVAMVCAPVLHAQLDRPTIPRLHHVGLNSVDPDAAIAWYLKLWPTAHRTTLAGLPGVEAEMLLLFTKVERPPAGAWSDVLHRSEPQSAFWHIGASTNTTDVAARLAPLGITHQPLYLRATDSTHVWRAGLAPYLGLLTATQLDTATVAAPRDGGFSYIVAPDGVLFELVGTPTTKDAFSHLHFFHSQPHCAANWYVEQLGMVLPAGRSAVTPCDVAHSEPSFPSLERTGTVRQPSAGVRFANGTVSWYPRTGLVPSRGQALDHVAFSVDDLDVMLRRLRRNGVRVLLEPYDFGDSRAAMIEGPDGLAIELVEERR